MKSHLASIYHLSHLWRQIIIISLPGFSRQAYVMFLLLLSSSSFFNACLEQTDLSNYKTNLHQIIKGGRHVGVDVQSGIGFATGQGTLLWQPNFRREIGQNRQHAFILGTRIPQWMAEWESRWAR